MSWKRPNERVDWETQARCSSVDQLVDPVSPCTVFCHGWATKAHRSATAVPQYPKRKQKLNLTEVASNVSDRSSPRLTHRSRACLSACSEIGGPRGLCWPKKRKKLLVRQKVGHRGIRTPACEHTDFRNQRRNHLAICPFFRTFPPIYRYLIHHSLCFSMLVLTLQTQTLSTACTTLPCSLSCQCRGVGADSNTNGGRQLLHCSLPFPSHLPDPSDTPFSHHCPTEIQAGG